MKLTITDRNLLVEALQYYINTYSDEFTKQETEAIDALMRRLNLI
jgi:hypothetical protein